MQVKLAPATQGIEWLNQCRNMDAEAFALIGTGFDRHVQHRLIKPKIAKSPKIAATFRTHVQDQSVFQVLLNDSIKIPMKLLSVCD